MPLGYDVHLPLPFQLTKIPVALGTALLRAYVTQSATILRWDKLFFCASTVQSTGDNIRPTSFVH